MKENVDVLKKGTTIFNAKPFAFVLDPKHTTSRCDNCTKSGKLVKCSACQYVYYCDRACQKEAWPVHKSECPNLKRISPKVVPAMARLMARVIVKLSQGGADEVGYYTDTSYRKFKDLMSHYSDIKKDEKRMEHFACLCAVWFEFLGNVSMPNTAELMGIYGRICINSFNIVDMDMNSIGVGIYLGPSVMDHSCKPNAVVVFDGTTIIIRTVEDLPCLDWSQVRISYIDVLKSTKDRRQELKSAYYFWCNCDRCERSDPMIEAAACPNESCTSPCSSESNQCEECGTKLSEQFKETFNEVVEFTGHHLQELRTMAYLDVSKICLRKQEGILHPFNVQHVQTLEAAFDAAIKLECWEEADFYAIKLIPGYLKYYGEVHPLTGILYLTAGKIKLYLEKSKQALELLKKANTILAITHGEKHSLIRESLKPLLYQATMEAY